MIAERAVEVDGLASPELLEALLQGGLELRGGHTLHTDSMPEENQILSPVSALALSNSRTSLRIWFVPLAEKRIAEF